MDGYHLRREDFTVGWVSALPIELAAARKVLDEEYESHDDDSTYTLGRIGEHNIVIACFPAGQLGISTGATAAAELKSRFPALEFCLMVGIGGGVPSPENDVRLGDVVISQPQGTYGGVVQYDLGKTLSGGQQMRTGFLNAPPATILKTVSRFQSNHTLDRDNMSAHLAEFDGTPFDRRRAGPDVLFQSSCRHVGGSTCVNCSLEYTVPRAPRTGNPVTVHYGTIASGNQVIKDAITRDRLSAELGGVLCFEMEAAGLMNNLPCLVIRGISDYCDSHKNASWQPFAAAVAAACAKEILSLHPTSSGLKQRKAILDWISPPEQEQRHAFVTGPRAEGTGGWLLEHPRSLLRQLLDYTPNIPNKIVEAHNRLGGSECSISASTLEKIILQLIQSSPNMYVLIDALDECVDPSRRNSILGFLEQATCTPNIRLLLTSRPHVQEIRSAFPESHRIRVRASEADLKAYVSQEIRRARVDDIVDTALARRIRDTITHQADGMFLLSVLRTKTVLREPTAGHMEDSLSSLGRDLPEIFRTTVSRIQQLPEGKRRLGMTALMFLSHVQRPITVHELVDILSVQLGQTTVRPKHRPLPRIVLECCLGLMSIEPTTQTVRLSHYAVNEYLVANSHQLFGDAEASISALCLTYLLLDPFIQGPRKEEPEIEDLIKTYPFVSYAATHWGKHVRGREAEPVVWDLALRFLGNHQATASSVQIMQYNRNYRDIYLTPEECYSTNALHLTSDFGLEQLVLAILSQEPSKLNATTTIGTTAIIKAASSGHVSTVRALLQKGADPFLENWYGNALHCAAEAGHCSTIVALVSHGMDPNGRAENGRYPIECTLDDDHAEAFGTLAGLGARIERRGREPPMLFDATERDCVRIVDLILRRGWVDVNCSADGGLTAAHVAARQDNTVILGMLIQAGADIEALDHRGLTPLDWAQRCHSHNAVKLLQAHGVGSVYQSRYHI
ncbi:hypothetical protein HFD88_004162 [Aspergillus terreus]|nr:hypothetical protein HFD88_004162 [Aspergillus terreus]